MQGKGAGPVNRVELESQVLCAALRQSCHVKDRVGAFTSVRELSHLFPDLLPPPEKDHDSATNNKANFYNVLGIRPQTSANGVISAYLRTVRAFLRSSSVKDARVEYNRILNAGFILRKPRLRLSHDLVVARRWLHEESRLSAIAQQEVTLDRDETLRAFKKAASVTSTPAGEMIPAADSKPAAVAQAAPAAASAPWTPQISETPAAPAPPPVVPAAASADAPPAVPPSPVVPAAVAASAPPTVTPSSAVPAVPTSEPGYSPETRSPESLPPSTGVPVPPVPPLPQPTSTPQASMPAIPPMPAGVSEYWEKQQSAAPEVPAAPVAQTPSVHVPPVPQLPNSPAEAPAPAPVAPPAAPAPTAYSPDITPAVSFPAFAGPPPAESPPTEVAAPTPVSPAGFVDEGEIEIAPGVFVPASSVGAEADVEPAPPVAPPEAPVAPSVSPPPPPLPLSSASADFDPSGTPSYAQPAAPSNGGNGGARSGDESGFPPAAVRAQSAPAPAPSSPSDRPPGRISKEATFVFDESSLHRPQSQAVQKSVPTMIQLMEAAQFINQVEVQAILAQMEFAPNVPVEKLILNAGYVTLTEMASIKLGESLLEKGKITMAQFQVAIYDERTSGLRMAESLQVRGWLNTEVRNAIDEFQRKRS